MNRRRSCGLPLANVDGHAVEVVHFNRPEPEAALYRLVVICPLVEEDTGAPRTRSTCSTLSPLRTSAVGVVADRTLGPAVSRAAAMSPGKFAYSASALTTTSAEGSSGDTPFGYLRCNVSARLQ